MGWDVCDGGSAADDPSLIPDDIIATLDPINDNGPDTAVAVLKDVAMAMKAKTV
ncbi:hypothetical protein P7F60_02670 [Rhizobium sp. YJ-22]|uniref:hypothetical protein n=1 Tax=Rhizobium sp. YJ-22 TaxID=3037556 RepID=UPI0024126125|nr:hypothetical protein [Rhizobium sp. YJ-22]MDG3575277.1 hypothetical protein [Rhizobium sp. YJ-22]